MAWTASSDWERWDPCQYVICPYNKSHRILVSRFQRHLVKCRLNYPNKDFVSCPFNASHQILRPHLRNHICSCPDKNVVEPAYGYNKDEQPYFLKGDTSVPSYYSSNFEDEPDEDWDKEIMADESYTPPVNLVGKTKPVQQKSIMFQTRDEFKRQAKQKALEEGINRRWCPTTVSGNPASTRCGGTQYEDYNIFQKDNTRYPQCEDSQVQSSVNETGNSDGYQVNSLNDVVPQQFSNTCRLEDRNKGCFSALSSVGRGRARTRLL